MMKIFTLIIILVLGIKSFSQTVAPKSESPLVLQNATIIDGTGAEPMENQTLVLKNGKISTIFESGSEATPADAFVMDLSGRYIIPGLIDSHVHLGTFPSSVDDRAGNEKLLKEALYKGITSVRDMAGDARALASLARDAKVGDITSPDIYYSAVMGGTKFAKDPRNTAVSIGAVTGEVPWSREITKESDLRQIVAEAKGAGVTGIKIYADLSFELLKKLTAEGHRQGLPVWAHAAVLPASPKEVVEAGVDGISHFTMLYTTVLSEMSGEPLQDMLEGRIDDLPMEKLSTDPPALDKIFQMMKENKVIFDPTMWISGYSQKYPEEYRKLACYYINKAEEMGIPQATGTDQMIPTKPKIPLIEAIKMKVEICGLTPLQAIRSATLYGAMAIGNEEKHGSVEEGKIANLVVLSSDPTEKIENLREVMLVFKNGKIYDPRSKR